jgi:hypothetical protein
MRPVIDMRADQLDHGEGKVILLCFAAFGSSLGQEILFDDIGKKVLAGTISDTQDVERPLDWRRVFVRKRLARKSDLMPRHLGCIMMGRPEDDSAGFISAEPKHDVSGELIGGIFPPAEHRYFQHIEDGMPCLVKKYIKLALARVAGLPALPRRSRVSHAHLLTTASRPILSSAVCPCSVFFAVSCLGCVAVHSDRSAPHLT